MKHSLPDHFQTWVSVMASYDPAVGHKRTAILVVHGIGSQRALETVRGVIRGVWLDRKNPADKDKRIWTHPEKDGADIDLSVMTTRTFRIFRIFRYPLRRWPAQKLRRAG